MGSGLALRQQALSEPSPLLKESLSTSRIEGVPEAGSVTWVYKLHKPIAKSKQKQSVFSALHALNKQAHTLMSTRYDGPHVYSSVMKEGDYYFLFCSVFIED